MRLIPVGGFLGAGKTTLLWEAARRLSQRGHSVGLVTNDQVPGLVDTALLSRLGSSVREVAGSCFCCNFNGLADAVDALANEGADCVLAEPVGSCTDLSATILQPVKALYPHWRVSPLSVLVDPLRLDEALRAAHPLLHADAAYILRLQLEEADQILLNKVDTLSPSEYERQMALLAEEFPGIPVKGASALNGQGIDDWLESVLSGGPAGSRIAPVDYDRYANGEAALGWLNVEAKRSGAHQNAARLRRRSNYRQPHRPERPSLHSKPSAGNRVAECPYLERKGSSLARANRGALSQRVEGSLCGTGRVRD
jgi:Ni2+-binding GTPase involved in maturation of urease and hydrogenase